MSKSKSKSTPVMDSHGKPTIGHNRPVPPAAFWQVLKVESHKAMDVKSMAAIHCIHKLAPGNDSDNDAERFAIIDTWPSADARVKRPGKKKGSTSEILAITNYFNSTPYGVELTSRLNSIKALKQKSKAQEDERDDITAEINNAVKIMRQVKRVADQRAALMSAGFSVLFRYVTPKPTQKPIRIAKPAKVAANTVWSTVSIASFLSLYPKGAKGGTVEQLFAAKAPETTSGANDTTTKPATVKNMGEMIPMFTAIEGYMSDRDRMKHIRGIGVKHDLYAHMRETALYLLDAVAPAAGDKQADVLVLRDQLRGLLPVAEIPVPEKSKPKVQDKAAPKVENKTEEPKPAPVVKPAAA